MKSSSITFVLAMTFAISLAVVSAGDVLAWHWTRGPFIDCSHVHWEIQNIENKPAQFSASVIEPESYSTSGLVAPNGWGVLDKQFSSSLSGNVKVRATISMGGDNREVTRDLVCGATPSTRPSGASSTPTSSSGLYPSSTPYVSPTPATGSSYLTTPSTGINAIYLIGSVLVFPLGFALMKFKNRHHKSHKKHLTHRKR